MYFALGLITALVASLLIRAAMQPKSFRIERSAIMKAPAAKIFGLINDFHGWREWSPWENLDPNLKRRYSGPASGEGAVYEWTGNSKAGQGRMEIAESSANSRIRISLDFVKPMACHNTAEFTLESGGEFTTVTWAMYGPSTLIMRVSSAFMSVDKMLGSEFVKGLAKLKALAEA